MMPRRDVTFPIALLGSLALHGVLLVALARDLAPPIPTQALQVTVRRDESPDPLEPTDFLGNLDTRGRATDSSPGEESQLANLGNQEQALLSLDPTGAGANDKQAPSPLPPPDPQPQRGSGDALEIDRVRSLSDRAAELIDRIDPPDATIGLPKTNAPSEPYRPRRLAQSNPVLESVEQDSVEPPTEPAIGVAARTLESRSDTPADRSTDPPEAQPPAQAQASADPRPPGKTESDAFSEDASIDVRVGKVVARTGRPHRITRPREGLSGMLDAFASPGMTLTLRLRLSPAGDVTDVRVVRSSGSNSIDQPWKVAAYSWWFEPKKDGAGMTVEDSMQLTLRFM